MSTSRHANPLSRMIFSRFIAILSGCGTLLFGFSPLHAAYPLVVDDAAIHPRGETEIVASTDGIRDGSVESVMGNFSVTRGLLSRLEGSLTFGYGWQRDEDDPADDGRSDILDLGLGLKCPLAISGKSPVDLAIGTGVVIPGASDGPGVDAAGASLLLIATRDQGDVRIDFNAGMNWELEDGAGTGDAAFVGTGIRWQINRDWMAFAETFATIPIHARDDAHSVLRCGCQVEITPGFFLGAALSSGYAGTRHEGGSLGLTFVF